ncbi:MAG: prepilin-type N-terminal cleavage/methylation domain-containing protein [Planctomycetales bacterium]|nr:prepilin-type N-terminal cleavage/methylation domain-containing protein [Planctomycetales bacterium]
MPMKNHSRGFSVVELLVTIGVVSLLFAMSMPAIESARASARRAQCAYNLRNIGQAYHTLQATRHNVAVVSPGDWRERLGDEVKLDSIFRCPSDSGQSAEELLCRVTHGGWPVQHIPFRAGPRCQQKNVTVNSEELWFEDWNNWDFADLRVLVEQQPDDTRRITVIQVDSSSTFDILTSSGSVLLDNVNKKNWPGRWCLSTTEDASYGVNNRCAEFGAKDARKILLVEYEKSVASVVGADATDRFIEKVAARHHGQCNALFVDGSVEAFDPVEIDPANLSKHDLLWRPESSAQLAN